MKVESTIFSEMRGSLGGMTASRNRYGAYVRNRTIPVDPRSALQIDIRNAMADQKAYWREQISAVDKAAWDVYAANTGWLNKLGKSVNLTGELEYLRQAIPSVQAGIDPIETGPTTYYRPSLTPGTTFSVDAASDELEVALAVQEQWLDEDGAFLAVYCSRPQNPTRNFWGGPYRYAGVIEGDSVTPLSGTYAFTLPFVALAGQVIFGYALLRRAEGVISIRRPFRAVAA